MWSSGREEFADSILTHSPSLPSSNQHQPVHLLRPLSVLILSFSSFPPPPFATRAPLLSPLSCSLSLASSTSPSRSSSSCSFSSTTITRDFCLYPNEPRFFANSPLRPFSFLRARASSFARSLARSRARLLPGRITYNYLKTRLHGAWERLSTLVMPSQSRVHIGPLETSSKTRSGEEREMLMRPGRRVGRRGREGREGTGSWPRCLIVSFFVGIGAPRVAYLARRIRDALSPSLHIFGALTTDRSDRSIDERTLNGG